MKLTLSVSFNIYLHIHFQFAEKWLNIKSMIFKFCPLKKLNSLRQVAATVNDIFTSILIVKEMKDEKKKIVQRYLYIKNKIIFFKMDSKLIDFSRKDSHGNSVSKLISSLKKNLKFLKYKKSEKRLTLWDNFKISRCFWAQRAQTNRLQNLINFKFWWALRLPPKIFKSFDSFQRHRRTKNDYTYRRLFENSQNSWSAAQFQKTVTDINKTFEVCIESNS